MRIQRPQLTAELKEESRELVLNGIGKETRRYGYGSEATLSNPELVQGFLPRGTRLYVQLREEKWDKNFSTKEIETSDPIGSLAIGYRRREVRRSPIVTSMMPLIYGHFGRAPYALSFGRDQDGNAGVIFIDMTGFELSISGFGKPTGSRMAVKCNKLTFEYRDGTFHKAK